MQTSRKGVHCDGGGLRRRVKAASASWVLRYTAPSAKRRELGLGAADQTSTAAAGKSLRDARDAADNARKLIRSGVDPIDEKRAKREKAREAEVATKAETRRERTTLARVARAYHERVIEPKRTEVHAREWISSLERHVPRGDLAQANRSDRGARAIGCGGEGDLAVSGNRPPGAAAARAGLRRRRIPQALQRQSGARNP